MRVQRAFTELLAGRHFLPVLDQQARRHRHFVLALVDNFIHHGQRLVLAHVHAAGVLGGHVLFAAARNDLPLLTS